MKVGAFTEPGFYRVSNVARSGNLLIAIGETTDSKDHLLVLDITNRIAPRRVAKIDLTTGGAQDIAILGDRAIILDAGRGKLLFFDAGRPEQTSQIGELSLSSPFQLTAEGTTAAVLIFSTRAVALYDIGSCLALTPRKRAVGRR